MIKHSTGHKPPTLYEYAWTQQHIQQQRTTSTTLTTTTTTTYINNKALTRLNATTATAST